MNHVHRFTEKARRAAKSLKAGITRVAIKIMTAKCEARQHLALASNRLSTKELAFGTSGGSNFMEDAGGWLIAAVIAFLVLVSIYSLFKTGIIPNVSSKSSSMFNYSA